MRLALAGLLLSLAAMPVVGQGLGAFPPTAEALSGFLTASWQLLPEETRRGWAPRLTPPFPARWPPAGRGAVVYDAFAYRLDGLMDGERVARPWARVLAAPGTPLRVERLAGPVEPLAIQGFRPLWPGEVTAAPGDSRLAALLAALAAVPPDGSETATTLRRAYCGWQGFNGVIAAALRESHAAFFSWLACH